ncbi:MAG: hypothetical protein WBC40_06235 [Halobacteriota archaeon]
MAEAERDMGIGVDKLDTRGDTEKFKGLYRVLVQRLNSTHDALSLNGLPQGIKPKRR